MKAIDVAGRCRCRRVAFLLREEPIAFYLCHCTECQADSGSAFGQSMQVRSDAVDRVEGPTEEHVILGSDGRRNIVTRCQNCATPLWFTNAEIPQVRGLNAGCLEDVAGLTPYGNMWTSSARPWVALAPGPQFTNSPEDPLAMIHAWQARPRERDD